MMENGRDVFRLLGLHKKVMGFDVDVDTLSLVM